MKLKLAIVAGLVILATHASAVTVIVTNGRGPAATREVVNQAGALVTGFGAFGVLNEAGILGANTTFEGLNFQQFGLGGGSVSTSTNGQFSYTGDVGASALNASTFIDKNIYLIVGFGGADLATSTELFIYKFTQTFGDLTTATPVTQTLSSSVGTTLLGAEVGDPMSASSGRYHSVALVPEPSAALLSILGVFGLIRRRR